MPLVLPVLAVVRVSPSSLKNAERRTCQLIGFLQKNDLHTITQSTQILNKMQMIHCKRDIFPHFRIRTCALNVSVLSCLGSPVKIEC